MGKRVKVRDKVVQRSIGFNLRQIEFFEKYPEFKPDTFCRKVIDEQIHQIDDSFLKIEKNNKNNEDEQ